MIVVMHLRGFHNTKTEKKKKMHPLLRAVAFAQKVGLSSTVKPLMIIDCQTQWRFVKGLTVCVCLKCHVLSAADHKEMQIHRTQILFYFLASFLRADGKDDERSRVSGSRLVLLFSRISRSTWSYFEPYRNFGTAGRLHAHKQTQQQEANSESDKRFPRMRDLSDLNLLRPKSATSTFHLKFLRQFQQHHDGAFQVWNLYSWQKKICHETRRTAASVFPASNTSNSDLADFKTGLTISHRTRRTPLIFKSILQTPFSARIISQYFSSDGDKGYLVAVDISPSLRIYQVQRMLTLLNRGTL